MIRYLGKCTRQYFVGTISNIGSRRGLLFYIQNRPHDSNELVFICVTPLCIAPTGQSLTVGSDAAPDNRVGICVPAFIVTVSLRQYDIFS